MNMKLFFVRDAGTTIPAMAVKLEAKSLSQDMVLKVG